MPQESTALAAYLPPEVYQEILDDDQAVTEPVPTEIKVDHNKTGKHQFYTVSIDEETGEMTETYLGNQIEMKVVYHQRIRAYFKDGDETPTCAAIADVPNVETPIAHSCNGCIMNVMRGACKPKHRLFGLVKVNENWRACKLLLSPTSLKHWNEFVSQLQARKTPTLAIITRFTLKDVQKTGYRWAEMIPGLAGYATKDELPDLMAARNLFKGHQAAVVSGDDYTDAGDRGKDSPAVKQQPKGKTTKAAEPVTPLTPEESAQLDRELGFKD